MLELESTAIKPGTLILALPEIVRAPLVLGLITMIDVTTETAIAAVLEEEIPSPL